MKKVFFLVSVLILTVSCHKKPIVTKTIIPLNSEFASYFISQEVGTCWVYEDTFFHTGKRDTIELTDKFKAGNGYSNNIECEGWFMSFKPKKSMGFTLEVTTGKNGKNFQAIINPPIPPSGNIWFGMEEDSIPKLRNYKDSLVFKDTVFKKVIFGKGSTLYHSNVVFAKNVGLVFFIAGKNDITGDKGGTYKLIKMYKK